ncbi:MAG TPA: CBS domain-containing protein [Kaistia sp.]|nr:CBS domain-containing protein [Kaistia sp.]
MHAEAVMTTPVISVEPTTSIDDAAKLMLSHKISGLPVVEADGRLVGIVSEGDFLRRSELATGRKRSRWLEFLLSPGQAASDYVESHARRVGDVMTHDVETASPATPLETIVEIMTRRRVKRVPIVDGNGSLLGIVSRSDLMKAMVRAREEAASAPSDDATIRSALAQEFGRQSWSGNGLIRVHVENGSVDLTGTIFDERERAAARVVAENVPGVRTVVDNLVCVEPISGLVIMPPKQTS